MLGDFVEIVKQITEGNGAFGEDTVLNNEADIGRFISATALSNTKVAILHFNKEGTSNNEMYLTILKIGRESITEVVTHTLSVTTNANFASITGLTENKVFITFGKDNNSNLYGTVCEINETTIIEGTSVKIDNVALNVSAIKLSENKVFISYVIDRTNWRQVCACVCEINETTITIGSAKVLSQENTKVYQLIAIKIIENKILVIFSYDNSYHDHYYLASVICEINGMEVNKYTKNAITNRNVSFNAISGVILSETKAFITCRCNNQIFVIVCEISGTVTSQGTLVQLDNINNNTINSMSTIKLSENEVFVFYGKENNEYLHVIRCTIEGNTITAGTSIQLSNSTNSAYCISAIIVSDNEILITHSSSTYCLNAIIYSQNAEMQVKTLANGEVAGVAKQSGTDGQMIKVVIPNRKKEEN